MSGLGEFGELPGFVTAGGAVQQKDIDQYEQYFVFAPSVDTAYIGTITTATNGTFVTKNYVPDYPRNLAYSVTGVAAGMGGTFDLSGYDQFGSPVKEHVVIGSANGGGTTQGTQMFGSIVVGTFASNGPGTTSGTAAIGFGTGAGATGNWFGLPVKIQSTADIRLITWISTNTPTTLNKGTGLGTLVSTGGGTTPAHAFQGTSGVAATDRYLVTIKTTYDNINKGILTNL